MPKPLPPELAPFLTPANESSEQLSNLTPPTDTVLRVLGGIGLPSTAVVDRMGGLSTPDNGERSMHPISEALREQVESSFTGFNLTLDAYYEAQQTEFTDRLSVDGAQFSRLLEQHLSRWGERGSDGKSVFDFIREQMEAHPETNWTLVAVPVLPEAQRPLFDGHTVIQTAFKALAEDMPNSNTGWIYDTYCQGYTNKQIFGESAPDAQLSVRFELVPTTFTEEVPAGTVSAQKVSLAVFQDNNPSANLHISSPLAQLSRLHTLKAQTGADSLANFDYTFIRNFDLPEIGGYVPCSYVYDVGYVAANRNGAAARNGSRVAAG
jgi:hypothetical protein